MRYLSVCSGIEAATSAWHPLGWEPFAFSEIEPFPSAVLAHHYPNVPNLGDMTQFKDWPDAAIDLLVGGTPCQSFSVAGLRKGLADPRGNLMLTYGAIAAKYRPQWLVWENVPGVLSSNGGRDFGTFLGMLAELGYGFAYRVLDAQYLGVAQRRRRVFVVGHLGDWRRAAAVLFERHSLQGNPAPSREAGKSSAACAARSVALRGREGGATAELGDDVQNCLRASGGGGDKPHVLTNSAELAPTLGRCAHKTPANDFNLDGGLVTHTLRGEGFDASEDGTGRGTPLVPVAFQQTDYKTGQFKPVDCALPLTTSADRSRAAPLAFAQSFAIQAGALRTNPDSGPDGVGVQADHAYTLEARSEVQAVAFAENSRHELRLEGGDGQRTGALSTGGGKPGQGAPMVASSMQVRRLTPVECERLQGFPDNHTAVPYRNKPACDGPRYKALGNSMAVPVMSWIGERIQMVAAINMEAGKVA